MSTEQASYVEPEGAKPEVERPNSYPTGSRFDTFTGNYAAGFPDTPTITESSERARKVILQRSIAVTELIVEE